MLPVFQVFFRDQNFILNTQIFQFGFLPGHLQTSSSENTGFKNLLLRLEIQSKIYKEKKNQKYLQVKAIVILYLPL